MFARNGVIVVAMLATAPAARAQHGADSSYIAVGDARVKGLTIRPYARRFNVTYVPNEPSSEDTAEGMGTLEERVQLTTVGSRPAILQIDTWHALDRTTVDSTLFDRRTLALISYKARYWNGYVTTYKTRGRHVSYEQRAPDGTGESAESSFTTPAFVDGVKQLFLLALAPALRADATFRIPLLTYDNQECYFVREEREIRVTGQIRYPWPLPDSTDVWIVTFAGKQLWVAADSRRIVEQRSNLGDLPRFMKLTAIP